MAGHCGHVSRGGEDMGQALFYQSLWFRYYVTLKPACRPGGGGEAVTSRWRCRQSLFCSSHATRAGKSSLSPDNENASTKFMASSRPNPSLRAPQSDPVKAGGASLAVALFTSGFGGVVCAAVDDSSSMWYRRCRSTLGTPSTSLLRRGRCQERRVLLRGAPLLPKQNSARDGLWMRSSATQRPCQR